ncbi:MAG: TonB-dependent receptor, partial [Candidatus Cloacimonetes bacterium]|nr:TonB-dependent receptor [Candidatus Cloacimonadota bacterium]
AGRVTIENSGQPLANAAVILVGTDQGTYTKDNGTFTLIDVPVGMIEVQFRYMGYGTKTLEAEVVENETVIVNVKLVVESIGIEGINIVSERAKERQTPVAFTDMDKEAMTTMLGSRDIPLVLTTTPSVYATDQGGGAGDARVNVRGFDQKNVAIMINGVPVNDMENGWVYWSNWDGVGDATSSIQMQRGLSAVNLAAPSIGGTMNIITDPTALKKGVKVKQEFGNGAFMKTTFMASSGLINNKFAISGGGVRKSGDGVVDKTWTDAWAYYLSSGFNINNNNKIELYVVGAPQRHGQNLYKQNIAVYDREYAEDLGEYNLVDADSSGTPDVFENFPEGGREYSQNWGSVSSSYEGQQWWNGAEHDRHDEGFINERENFYHKPQINLNWYTKLNERLNMYSILYYSGGKGGGTGTYGSIEWDYSTPTRTPDWDATIAENDTSSTGSFGILRNSVNNQWTVGAISKAYFTVNENFKTSVGFDWRTAEIDHFREVRDLLGGEYYYYDGNDFDEAADYEKGLGDKIAYHFTNNVDWLGGYVQGEITLDDMTSYSMIGLSRIKYYYVNHFKDVGDGEELTAETDWINGFQIKGGSSYKLTENIDVFGNAGYVSKVPIFDDVIDDYNGTKAENPKNEKFTSLEAGWNYSAFDGLFKTKSNFYYTVWEDKSKSQGVTNPEGEEGIVFINGLNSRHWGVELETSYRPTYMLQFDISASLGNWIYTNDVTATYDNYSSAGFNEIDTLNIYVDGLKVGDAPQTQLSFGTSIFPIDGLKTQFVVQHYRDHYAAWDAFGRTDPDDTTQSWKMPAYSKFDIHMDYLLPVNFKGVNVSVFAHLFNVLDAVFVQDATDNSHYNGFDGDHDADDAEVFFGAPRTFNAGLNITF